MEILIQTTSDITICRYVATRIHKYLVKQGIADYDVIATLGQKAQAATLADRPTLTLPRETANRLQAILKTYHYGQGSVVQAGTLLQLETATKEVS